MKVHDLKTVQPFFTEVESGAKTFEIRKNDREFNVGDRLVLREYHPESDTYTGNIVVVDVVYLTNYQQQPGYVVMGIRSRFPGYTITETPVQ